MRIFIIVSILLTFTAFSCKDDTKTAEVTAAVVQHDDSIFSRGKSLFKENCVACHYIGMDLVKTAPALGGVTARREKDWLYRYTRNSISMFNEGDSIAVQLRSQNWGLMSSFPKLKDKDLDAIYYFVDQQYETTKRDSLRADK